MPRVRAPVWTAAFPALPCAARVSAGTFTVLHRVEGGADGSNEDGPLASYRGQFDGTTLCVGTNGGYGTAYRIRPGGRTRRLSNDSGGCISANLLPVAGALYGTAAIGGAKGEAMVFR